MKGDPKVIKALSEALSEELSAINQYFLHAEMCESWGFGKLAAFVKKQAIDEMRHAESIIERILFLEGIPDMTKYQKLNIGKDVPEMIKNDLALEHAAVKMYNKMITISVEANDHVTADFFKTLLTDEEMHVDWLEEQGELIDQLGKGIYLQMQIEPNVVTQP